MAHSYYELHYHLVWGTKGREAMVLPDLRYRLYACIRENCEAKACTVHEIGGVEDHVHVALSIPATASVAEVVHDAKGSSSHLVNAEGIGRGLYWQPGYGAMSIRKKDVPAVRRYIQEQKQRHDESRLWADLERLGEDGVPA